MHASGVDVAILVALIYSLLVNCNLPYLEGHLVHRDIVLETGRQFILGTIGENQAGKGGERGGKTATAWGSDCWRNVTVTLW